MTKTLYFIEVTDTFGGEANYSWVTRHVIKAMRCSVASKLGDEIEIPSELLT